MAILSNAIDDHLFRPLIVIAGEEILIGRALHHIGDAAGHTRCIGGDFLSETHR